MDAESQPETAREPRADQTTREESRTVKHEWRGDGWRRHVVSWSGVYDPSRSWRLRGVRRCSEPNCEVNRES